MKYIHNVDTYQDYIALRTENNSSPNLSLIQDRNVMYNINDTTYEIGTPSTSSRYLPTYTVMQWTCSQQIYTAAEIGGKAGNIIGIAFKSYNRSTTREFKILLSHTTKTLFDNSADWIINASNPGYECYYGKVTITAGNWVYIPFDRPFAYDGTRNLVICVLDSTRATTGTSSSNALQFYVYNGGNTRSLYYTSSSFIYIKDLSKKNGTYSSYVNYIKLCINSPSTSSS